MAEPADESGDGRRELLDELRSLSAALGPPAQREPAYADIPVLLEVVELPRTTAAQAPAFAVAAPVAPQAEPPTLGIDVEDMGGAMEVEARFIVDELLDEFLPQVEARLRERLEQRMRELLEAPSPPAG